VECEASPQPAAPAVVSRTGSSSLIARVTEGRRAREKLIMKDLRAEFKDYLLEDLYYVNESEPPGQQAKAIFEWWKVCLLLIHSSMIILSPNATVECYPLSHS
jgi:hypothetical protein